MPEKNQKENKLRMKTEPVLWNRKVGPDCFRMGIGQNGVCRDAVPGQFVMLGLCDETSFVLRRPFSIHGLVTEGGRPGGLEILYKVVGKNTRAFSKLREGDEIDVLGPLGKGFSAPKDPDGRAVIVGGGIGVAPLLFLADFLIEKNMDPARCRVFLGGRTPGDVLCADGFEKRGMEVRVATDDGAAGRKGPVTDLVEKDMKKNPPGMTYACGPKGMLKRVSEICETYGAPCQASMETFMACGMGACLGCAAGHKTEDRYLHVCVDGPVMDPGLLDMASLH
ncbi:conserved hypothetical protein [Candidatus Desulfarcum epimagneticum]|uniref:Dihydroorotate dehydrogenase B (NAD(+)), electron transfer subunit n=1 Tax=uncultured Desulfobacteraceae bacterium TaxID=218296 RepID=A0A484HH36_9BACT|nr:conserved hypothetical protein [uncultured Desulfobacteraceae bacterium]